MKHVKEPWSFERIPAIFNPKMDGFQVIALSDDGNDVQTVALCVTGEHDEDNARRIVACVNACAGTSTEYLEGWAGPKDHLPIHEALDNSLKQRDELLEQIECSTITEKNMEGRLNIATVKLAVMIDQRNVLLDALIKIKGARPGNLLAAIAEIAIAKVQP